MSSLNRCSFYLFFLFIPSFVKVAVGPNLAGCPLAVKALRLLWLILEEFYVFWFNFPND